MSNVDKVVESVSNTKNVVKMKSGEAYDSIANIKPVKLVKKGVVESKKVLGKGAKVVGKAAATGTKVAAKTAAITYMGAQGVVAGTAALGIGAVAGTGYLAKKGITRSADFIKKHAFSLYKKSFNLCLRESIHNAKQLERELMVGDIVEVYDFFSDVQKDRKKIIEIYKDYKPKNGDIVEYKKGMVVKDDEEKKEDKKEDKKDGKKEEEEEKSSDDDEDKIKKEEKNKPCKEIKKEKKKEAINTGRILYRYNKDKAKSLSKVEKDRDQCNIEEVPCKFAVRDLKTLKIKEGVFLENMKPTIENILLSEDYNKYKEKQKAEEEKKRKEEAAREIEEMERKMKQAYEENKEDIAFAKNAAKSTVKSLEKPVDLEKMRKDFVKKAVINTVKKGSVEEGINNAAVNIVKETGKEIAENAKNQKGGFSKDDISKQMIALEKMNRKTKKGIIIEKKTIKETDDWKKRNLYGEYTVFIFENIDSSLLSLAILDEKDYTKAMMKFMKRKIKGMDELKKFCVLENLPIKAFKEKKRKWYKERKENDIVDVFFTKNNKEWKTIEKELEAVKKSFGKDSKDNPYEKILDQQNHKLYRFCQGKIVKMEDKKKKKMLTFELGVLRNIIKELGVELIKDNNGELVKDLTGRNLKVNDAFIGPSSKSVPLTEPTKSLYTFISDKDETKIIADYKTPKEHLTNYRKKIENHWLEHTININDDGTFFAILKAKEAPITVTREDKYNVKMDDTGNINYRNYYSSAKTEKAIGFKILEDPTILQENYKNYHPLDGSNDLIKDFLMDEISKKHEASKLAKEIEAEEEAERKKEEEEEAEIGGLQGKIDEIKTQIADAKTKIEDFKMVPESKMPEDKREEGIKIQKELISKLNRELKKQKKILKEANKCGRNPRTWDDYKKKMGCDIVGISNSISNMIKKLIPSLSKVLMKTLATLPGNEENWNEVYPIYVKAKENVDKNKASAEEVFLVKIVNDLLDELVAIVYKTSTYTVKNLERQVDPLLEKINIFVETIIKGFYSFIADFQFLNYAQAETISIVDGKEVVNVPSLLYTAVAVSRLLRTFLKKIDAVAGLEQRVFEMISQTFAIFPEIAGRIIQMINKVKILANIGLIMTQKDTAIIMNDYEIELFQKYYGEMMGAVKMIKKMKGRKYSDAVWEKKHEDLKKLIRSSREEMEPPRNETEREDKEEKAKEEAKKEKQFIEKVMKRDEKTVADWVKNNAAIKVQAIIRGRNTRKRLEEAKKGGGGGGDGSNGSEKDERDFCDIPCMLDKYYKAGEKEDIEDVEVYKTELKNNPTEERIKEVFDGKKLTEYDVNQRMDDVFADDTLKQLGFINDLLLYFVKDTIKIVAKDAVINLKTSINVQDKMLKQKIKKLGLIKAGKEQKAFDELTKKVEEGLLKTFDEVSESTGSLLKTAITKLINEIIILLVTKICSKPFAFCFPALEKLQKKSPNTSWEKVKEDAEKIKESIRNMNQPILEWPGIAGINMLIDNTEKAMEVSKFIGPKAIQHTVTKYVPKSVLTDPYAKIDKMMEKLTDELKEPLQEFKDIYDKTPKTPDRFQVALDEFIAKKMGGDDE